MNAKDAHNRSMYVYELRTKGLLFKEIAKIMGFSTCRAAQIYESALRRKAHEAKNDNS